MGKKSKARKTQQAKDDEDQRPASPTTSSPVNGAATTSSSPPPAPKSPVQETDVASSSATPPPPTPSSTPPQDPEALKAQGNTEFKAGNYYNAIDFYSKAIELNPSEPNYWNNRAAAYIAVKKFGSALTDAQTAATLQSSSPQIKTLLRLARCHLALGNVTGALNTLTTASELPGESANSAVLTALQNAKRMQQDLATYLKAREQKDWGVARLALDRCIEGAEGNGSDEWKRWKIEMEIAKGRWDSATSQTAEALRKSPNSPDLLQLRALILFLTNSLAQSIQHLQSALRLDPEHKTARQLLRRIRDIERTKEEGNNLFKGGRFRDAVGKYTECLDLIGDKDEEGKGGQIRATLLSNRATALLKYDQNKEALDDATKSLELLPDNWKALRTKARCELALEDYEEAVRSFKAAMQTPNISREDERSLQSECQKAEVLLKRSKSKDYYKILGLQKNCTDLDIKKAYRRESLIHHPDKGGDEEKFKLIVEAHAVLSNPERRDRYDNGFDEDGQTEGGGMGGMGGGVPVDLTEILRAMGGGGGGGFQFGGGGDFGASYSGGFGGGGRRGFGGGGHGHSHGPGMGGHTHSYGF